MTYAWVTSPQILILLAALAVTFTAFFFIVYLFVEEGIQNYITKKANKLLESCSIANDARAFNEVESYFSKKKDLLKKRPSLLKKFYHCRKRRYQEITNFIRSVN